MTKLNDEYERAVEDFARKVNGTRQKLDEAHADIAKLREEMAALGKAKDAEIGLLTTERDHFRIQRDDAREVAKQALASATEAIGQRIAYESFFGRLLDDLRSFDPPAAPVAVAPAADQQLASKALIARFEASLLAAGIEK